MVFIVVAARFHCAFTQTTSTLPDIYCQLLSAAFDTTGKYGKDSAFDEFPHEFLISERFAKLSNHVRCPAIVSRRSPPTRVNTPVALGRRLRQPVPRRHAIRSHN
jgi:hypothetical protein